MDQIEFTKVDRFRKLLVAITYTLWQSVGCHRDDVPLHHLNPRRLYIINTRSFDFLESFVYL